MMTKATRREAVGFAQDQRASLTRPALLGFHQDVEALGCLKEMPLHVLQGNLMGHNTCILGATPVLGCFVVRRNKYEREPFAQRQLN
jgi:hypothetical protein